MYKKEKLISFRLEGRDLEKLINRASEFGLSPAMFAKKLVTENLDRQTDEELMERFEVLESKIEALSEKNLTFIKEVFYVTSNISHETLDEIEKKTNSN
jgi:predicted DNA binding CopG/RHH family protein